MGFHFAIHTILRSDEDYALRRGAIHEFTEAGSRVFCDDIPIWLTRSDWTALAEIQVRSQSHADGQLEGTFEVLHVYDETEQAPITQIFRRMYAGGGDPFIYVLRKKVDYEAALASGALYDDSLEIEGFIHASPSNELSRVANKYYRGVGEVVVCVVETVKVNAPVKWEPAAGSVYPHIYGPLNMDAVVWTVPVESTAHGEFDIGPEDLGRECAV